MNKFFRSSFFAFLLISSCSPATSVTYSWINPEAAPGKQHIFVAVLSENMAAKSVVEDQLVYELQALGVKASGSLSVFQPDMINKDPDDRKRELMLKKIREQGCDAILTIALIDESSETRFVPGDTDVVPAIRYRFYDGFNTYLEHYDPIINSMGYYTNDKTYFLETNFYDAQSKALLWTAQTETYNPTDIESFAGGFSKVIIARLKKKGLLETL